MRLFAEEACEAGLVLYTFYGFYLATDCFFVPAITVLTNKLHIPDDLAGATILGAALNAPELFSNLIGIFVLKNPVGLGLVMGSFNFNILCITGMTAIAARQRLRSRQLKLEWRYLQRDAGLYLAAVVLLGIVAADQVLEAWECFAMLALYALYVGLCVMTGAIARLCCDVKRKPRRKRPLGRVICEVMGEAWVAELVEKHSHAPADMLRCASSELPAPGSPATVPTPRAPAPAPTPAPAAPAVTAWQFPALKTIRTESSPVMLRQAMPPGDLPPAAGSPSTGTATPVWGQEVSEVQAMELRKVLQGLLDNGYTSLHRHKVADPPAALDQASIHRSRSAPVPQGTFPRLGTSFSNDLEQPLLTTVAAEVTEEERQRNWDMVENMLTQGSAAEVNHLLKADARLIAVAIDNLSHRKFATDVMQLAEMVEGYEEAETHDHEALLKWPQGQGVVAKLWFVVSFPLNALMSLTMFHQPELYLVTIVSAMAWLALLAYMLDWSASRVGCYLHIDDELIGMTVVAIGTSLPNVFAAVSAGAKGQVETSISQAFGSNIFDILVAFALPYTIQCGMQGWQPIPIAAGNVSRDGMIDAGVLLVYVLLLCYTRMRLTRVQGFLCLGMYALYLVYEVAAFMLVP
eukprot:jgi/Tetstr1/445370/TSEL_033168.t1